MRETDSVVAPDEAKAAVERVLKSEQFVGGTSANQRRRRIIKLLFEHSVSDPNGTIDSNAIATQLDSTVDTVRNDIADIRHKDLVIYYRKHSGDSVEIQIPERRRQYRLTFKHREAKSSLGRPPTNKISLTATPEPPSPVIAQPGLIASEPFTRVPLSMFHRMNPAFEDRYFRAAFSSGKQITYLTIMTKHLFPEIDQDLSDETKLTVLVWNPRTKKEIDLVSEYLREDDDKTCQTQEALEQWDERAAKRNNIKLLEYHSMPTMEGLIVENEYALIVLIPYATHPDSRPALLFRRDKIAERPAFEFFAERFRVLINSAPHRTIGSRSKWFLPLEARKDKGGAKLPPPR